MEVYFQKKISVLVETDMKWVVLPIDADANFDGQTTA